MLTTQSADFTPDATACFGNRIGIQSTMSVTGKIKNGVVELPPGAHFEEGQRVEIRAAPVSPEEALVLCETAPPFPKARDLPDDLAVNLDYYIHSHDHKQQPRRGRWIPAAHPMPKLTAQEAADCTKQLLGFAAETEGLPPDLAANHDHYLHGLPKK